MPADKKAPLATTVRPPSPPRIEPDAQHGLDTRPPATESLLEGVAAQAIQQDDAEETTHARFLRGSGSGAYNNRLTGEPVQNNGDDPVGRYYRGRSR